MSSKYKHRRKNRDYLIHHTKRSGNEFFIILLIGGFLGIVLDHVARKEIDPLYSKIPYLGTLPEN